VRGFLWQRRSDCWFRSDAYSATRAGGLIDVVGSGKALTAGQKMSLRRHVKTASLCVRAYDERISLVADLCIGEGLLQ
jgi:hypothetical protein